MTALILKSKPRKNGCDLTGIRFRVLVILALGLLLPLPAAAALPEVHAGASGLSTPFQAQWSRNTDPASGRLARGKTPPGLSPEERAELQRRWQSMPPEKKEEYRRRMKKFKRLKPQDRELYRRRYQQYQKLPPQDRRRIRQQLDQWDRLSPRERERIREKFLNRRYPTPRPGSPYHSG